MTRWVDGSGLGTSHQTVQQEFVVKLRVSRMTVVWCDWSIYLSCVKFFTVLFEYHHFGGEPGNSYICNCLIFLCCLFLSPVSSLPSNYNIRKGFILGFRLKMWYISSLMMQWNPGTPKIWGFANLFPFINARCNPADRLTDIFPRGKSLKPDANLEDGRLPIFVSAMEFGQLEGEQTTPRTTGTYDHHKVGSPTSYKWSYNSYT